ncbi:MAG: sel1 repeat family protein [Sphingomonadales bacterium]|nr:MAG: sel1 repeat family protein [Sphingomonadales bacterium]
MTLMRPLLALTLMLPFSGAHGQQSQTPPSEATVLRACEVGKNASACTQYGVLLMRGSPTLPKNEAMALLYIQMGCDRGHAIGCRGLGNITRQGNGVPINLPMARASYAKGCDLKDGHSCLRLGLMLGSGSGGPKDMAQATIVVSKACEYGEKQACPTGKETAAPPTAAERRTLTAAERRACGVQYLGYAELYTTLAMVNGKPAAPGVAQTQKRGMAMLGLADGTKLDPKLQLEVSTVRSAQFSPDKKIADAATRKMVTTIDDCDRAQGLARIK